MFKYDQYGEVYLIFKNIKYANVNLCDHFKKLFEFKINVTTQFQLYFILINVCKILSD